MQYSSYTTKYWVSQDLFVFLESLDVVDNLAVQYQLPHSIGQYQIFKCTVLVRKTIVWWSRFLPGISSFMNHQHEVQPWSERINLRSHISAAAPFASTTSGAPTMYFQPLEVTWQCVSTCPCILWKDYSSLVGSHLDASPSKTTSYPSSGSSIAEAFFDDIVRLHVLSSI